MVQFMYQLSMCKVPSVKARPYIMKHINKFIRGGVKVPSAEILFTTLDDKYKEEVNVATFKVWHMIFQLKQRLLDAIVVNGTVECLSLIHI